MPTVDETLAAIEATRERIVPMLVDSQSLTAEGGDDNDRGGPMNTVRYGVSTLSITH